MTSCAKALLYCAVGAWLTLSPLMAHEMWLDPADPLRTGTQSAQVDIRVGESLAGEAYPFLSDRAARVWTSDHTGLRALTPRLGDVPALQLAGPVETLTLIGYESRPSRLTYDSFGKFESFLAEEGLPHIADVHRARRLPEQGFGELFSRYAKTALIAGPTRSLPMQPIGRFDLSILSLPHQPVLSFRLTWENRPLARHPLSLITGDGAKQRLISDAEGRVDVAVPASGRFLLNAVYMEPVRQSDAVWHSHWASFYVER